MLGNNQEIPDFNYCVEDFALKLKPKNTWLAYVGAFNLQNFDLTADEQNIVSGYSNVKNRVPTNDFEIYNEQKRIYKLKNSDILVENSRASIDNGKLTFVKATPKSVVVKTEREKNDRKQINKCKTENNQMIIDKI